MKIIQRSVVGLTLLLAFAPAWGVAYQRTNQDTLALADYEASIKLNPRSGRSYVLHGLILLKKGGQDVDAWKDLNMGFQLDPGLHAEFDPMIKQLRPNE